MPGGCNGNRQMALLGKSSSSAATSYQPWSSLLPYSSNHLSTPSCCPALASDALLLLLDALAAPAPAAAAPPAVPAPLLPLPPAPLLPASSAPAGSPPPLMRASSKPAAAAAMVLPLAAVAAAAGAGAATKAGTAGMSVWRPVTTEMEPSLRSARKILWKLKEAATMRLLAPWSPDSWPRSRRKRVQNTARLSGSMRVTTRWS
mmetsp:Transcript_29991/g.76375  ORF Transcript_29991/g.76375 Transcript_29991/m.76375 type:complete len:203 (+) Transcript_29991:934-1542(+)